MFSERFTEILAEKNITMYRVAKDLNLNTVTVNKWAKGACPDTRNLSRLAEYLGVKIEYFLGESNLNENEDISLLSKGIGELDTRDMKEEEGETPERAVKQNDEAFILATNANNELKELEVTLFRSNTAIVLGKTEVSFLAQTLNRQIREWS